VIAILYLLFVTWKNRHPKIYLFKYRRKENPVPFARRLPNPRNFRNKLLGKNNCTKKPLARFGTRGKSRGTTQLQPE
jgi:hypothetical protein